MNEKRWAVSKEMLNVLRLIRSNCRMCSNCEWCPLASEDDNILCKLGNVFPQGWLLDGLEVKDEKEN